MAAVTLTSLTRADKDYKEAVSEAASGSATVGQVGIVYDDTQTQEEIVRALDKARLYVLETHKVR